MAKRRARTRHQSTADQPVAEAAPAGQAPGRESGPSTPPPNALGTERAAWAEAWRLARGALPVLGAILLLAVVLRFTRLTASELWLDELLVRLDALHGTNNHISRSHRLHLGIVGWFLNTMGDTPFWLRFWSAAAGSLAAPVMAWAGMVAAGRRLGAIAGVMAALHPFLVFYSQDANYYGGVTLWVSLQLLGFVLFFRGAVLGGGLLVAVFALAGYYSHPFAILFTGLAAGLMALGMVASPSLRREIFVFNPRLWGRNPFLPLTAGALIVAGPLFNRVLAEAARMARSRIEDGATPYNVDLSYEFFNRVATFYGVTYFANEMPVARLLAWVPVLLLLASVLVLALRARWSSTALPVAALSVLMPAVGLLVIFNLRHHGFYPRYLTPIVPCAILAISTASVLLVDRWANQRFARRAALVPAGVLALVQVPFLLSYMTNDGANFKALGETLRSHYTPGDPVYVAVFTERFQAQYYLQRGDNAVPDEAMTYIARSGHYDATMASHLVARLYGEDSAWVVSGWRTATRPHLWGLIDTINEPHYVGKSIHGPTQNAHLLHWDYGTRALLPGAATRVAIASDEIVTEMPVFFAGEGRWAVESPEGERIAVHSATGAAAAQEGEIVVERTGRAVLTFAQPLPAGEITIRPVFAETESFSPFVNYTGTEDSRHREVYGPHGPLWERRYDGSVTGILYVPPGEERQLVIKAMSRNRAELEERATNPVPDATLLVAVACDGVHLGTWEIPESDTPEVVRVPLDVTLPPGNHRLTFTGATPRVSYAPDNFWDWAGYEWNRAGLEDPVPPMEARGMQHQPVPGAAFEWGEPGDAGLPPGFFEMQESYNLSVNGEVRGLSGLPSLEVSLEEPLRGSPAAYHFIFAPPVEAVPGSLLAFGSAVQMENVDRHAFAMAVAYLSADRQLVHVKIGSQQLMVPPWDHPWHRFVELAPVPQTLGLANGATVPIGYVAPGIIIFPPDPERSNPQGRLFIDPIRSLLRWDEPLREMALDSRLIWYEEAAP